MKYKYKSNSFYNLGRDIENTIRNAVKPEDVQQLMGSLDDIMSELSQMGREFTEPRAGKPHTPPPPRVRTPRERPDHREKTVVYDNRPVPSSIKSIDGIVLTVLGTIFAALTAAIGVISVALFATGHIFSSSAASVISTVFGSILSVGTVASAFMLAKGTSLRRRAKRYTEYLKLFSGCKIYPVEQLSIVVDRSKGCVVRDLRRMIDTGKLPGAHLDAGKTSIILDEETYTQYLAAENKSRELSKLGKKKSAAMPDPPPAPEPAVTPAATTPVDAIIAEGRAYIDRINAANVIIKGDAVSQKIDILESTVSKIFDYVSEHPEKQGDLRKLMSYYLPTTLKLLDAYSKFEAHAIRGENVSTAMHEIEGALDTINLAFENLLDDLFEHEMYDITSDISALETMLAQEGLTAQDFAAKDDKNTAGGLQ